MRTHSHTKYNCSTKFYLTQLFCSFSRNFLFRLTWFWIPFPSNTFVHSNLLWVDDASGESGSGGGGGGGGLFDAPSASLQTIVGHFKFVSLDGDAIELFDAAHSGVHGGDDALEFKSARLCFDALRLRPNLRKENRGRKLNVELSHSALKLIEFSALVAAAAAAVASLESLFDVDTTRLLALCFRLFFFDELDLLMLLEALSSDSMLAIELVFILFVRIFVFIFIYLYWIVKNQLRVHTL